MSMQVFTGKKARIVLSKADPICQMLSAIIPSVSVQAGPVRVADRCRRGSLVATGTWCSAVVDQRDLDWRSSATFCHDGRDPISNQFGWR